MDLSLLYEFDVPQPWEGQHQWGQRMAERRVYRECIEQIVLAGTIGLDGGDRCAGQMHGDEPPALAGTVA